MQVLCIIYCQGCPSIQCYTFTSYACLQPPCITYLAMQQLYSKLWISIATVVNNTAYHYILHFPRTVAWYWWHTLDSNKVIWNNIASLTTHSSPLMKYRVLLILTYRFGHQDKNWAVSVYLHWRPGTMVCASEDGQWPSTTRLTHR